MELITSYDYAKVSDYLIKESPRKVCLIFWHGLGDVIMFMPSQDEVRRLFPETEFAIALQDGVGQEELIPGAILIDNPNEAIDGFNYTFQIHFNMSEHLAGAYTKQGWCCIQELGIDPVDEHPTLGKYPSRLVACHFQATALPDPINPSEEIAELIWNEVIDAGFIPIEAFFQHKYYNPVNAQFSFIDCTIRRAQPSVKALIVIYQSCAASICVDSGNFHISMAVMPDRTLYLEKEYLVKCYTKQDIATVDINNYKKGSVEKWLNML